MLAKYIHQLNSVHVVGAEKKKSYTNVSYIKLNCLYNPLTCIVYEREILTTNTHQTNRTILFILTIVITLSLRSMKLKCHFLCLLLHYTSHSIFSLQVDVYLLSICDMCLIYMFSSKDFRKRYNVPSSAG